MTKVIVTTDYSSKLAQLDSRAANIRERLIVIGSMRRDYLIAASDGDEKAISKLHQLDEEAVTLNRELDLLGDAQAELETKAREQQESKLKQEREAAEAMAVELTTDILACSSEVDQALHALCKLLSHRRSLLVSLERTKCRNVPNRLIGSRYAVTAAFRAAGLQNHAELGHIEPVHITPLVESNKSFGTVPPPTPKKIFTPPPKQNERYIG